ncbi:hypothetical protein HPP92_019990 [Vanilla planifolia]|uniref:Calmodulin-binding domain-containing protein n=1 Tax=Vanilla planifolia TaxID=51239 RepID=A0A835Q7X3_VANPL|nr:hypothetical protein HPP92_019990 [Vanilla planifolia]
MDKGSTRRVVNSVSPGSIDSRERPEKKTKGQHFLSNSYGHVQSRYLGSAMGSCHDLCKYGRKHDVVVEKLLTFKRFMANSLSSDAVQVPKGPKACERRERLGFKLESSGKVQNMQQEGKVAEMLKNQQTSLSKKLIDFEVSSIHESKESSEEMILLSTTLEHKTLSHVEDDNNSQSLQDVLLSENPTIELDAQCLPNKSIQDSPQLTLTHSLESELDKRKVLNVSKKKNQQATKSKSSPAQEFFSVKLRDMKDKGLSATIKISSAGGPSTSKEKVTSYMKETVSSSVTKGISQKSTALSKLSVSPSLQRMKHNVSMPYRMVNGYAKSAISLNSSIQPESNVPGVNCNMNKKSLGNLDKNVVKTFGKPKICEERKLGKLCYTSSITPAPTAANTTAENYRNMKHATPDRDVNLLEDGDYNRKNSNETVEENSDKQVKSNFFLVGDVCDFSKIQKMQRRRLIGSSNEEDKRATKRISVAQMDDNCSTPYKLKFKRGRMFELKTMENAGPRRLRFRKARVLGDKSNGDIRKRIFRRAISDSEDPSVEIHAVTLKETNPSEANNVTLKHLDAWEKKDMQALFNHVIEETASKLVETSKSKVKALVGAFETVISLQVNAT